MSRFIEKIGVVYTIGTRDRELAGKAINALRELGGENIGMKDALSLLMEKYDLMGVEAKEALDVGLKTTQVIKSNGFLRLDETKIREFGAEEHKVVKIHPRYIAKPQVSTEDDLLVIKNVLERRRGHTMLISGLYRALDRNGLNQRRRRKAVLEAEKRDLIVKDGIRVTWVELPAKTKGYDTISMPGI